MPVPNQVPKLKLFDDPVTQQHYDQLIDTVNTLAGYNGEIGLSDHINLQGKRIINLGSPVEPTDALSSSVAQSTYSASVLRPQLESNGSSPLKTQRRLNDPNQREQMSSYMNDLMSAVPNANGIYPNFSAASGGIVTVSVPASLFQFADGSSLLLQARVDMLSVPTSFAISSISVTSNLVTVVAASPTGLVSGNLMTITGVTPSQFNGAFPIISSTGGGLTLTYQDNIGTGSGSGGSIELNNVYYYAVKKRENTITLFGPFNGDTLQNRLQVNFDSFQIVAVIVLTASGGQLAQSGGGGSPIVGSPTAGSFF